MQNKDENTVDLRLPFVNLVKQFYSPCIRQHILIGYGYNVVYSAILVRDPTIAEISREFRLHRLQSLHMQQM